MPLELWDLGSLLAVLSIILASSSIVLTEKPMKRRVDLAAKVTGLAFLVVAIYLIWTSLA